MSIARNKLAKARREQKKRLKADKIDLAGNEPYLTNAARQVKNSHKNPLYFLSPVHFINNAPVQHFVSRKDILIAAQNGHAQRLAQIVYNRGNGYQSLHSSHI